MGLSPEELAMFGEPPASASPLKVESSVLNSVSVSDPVFPAVLPPDAPANSALPPPEPKKRGRPAKKNLIQDESTVPDDVLKAQKAAVEPVTTAPVIVAGTTSRPPACGFCGDITPKPDHAETCPMRRVNPLSNPEPLAPWDDEAKTDYYKPKAKKSETKEPAREPFEFGPKTLAVLEAIAAALAQILAK